MDILTWLGPVSYKRDMILGPLIRAWREKHRLGIRPLAKEIGISAATLARFETEENPDGRTLAKIATWVFLDKSDLEIR